MTGFLSRFLQKARAVCRTVSQKLQHFFRIFRKKRPAAFAAIASVAVVATAFFSGLTLAYHVIYNGSEIGLLKNKSDYDQAVTVAGSLIDFGELDECAAKPTFSVTVTSEKYLSSPDDVAIHIIENTKQVVYADALFVDGTFRGCVDSSMNLQNHVDEYLHSFDPEEGEVVSSSFTRNVMVESGYYVAQTDGSFSQIDGILSSLEVQTVVDLKEQSSIPFGSVTRKSDARNIGEVVTAVSGVPGVKESVQRLTYVNGQQTNSQMLEDVVVEEPVEEVIVVGTRPVQRVSAASVSSLGLIWPLKRSGNQLVSAYFGDGRNHKGVDIASPAGTPIYAGQSGTVTTATFSSSYGNYVVIDHGNGYQTLYAHASRLYVSAGEIVTQGQVIAAVGSTGISTGNHLHIEVICNGSKLDPAPFLGLY